MASALNAHVGFIYDTDVAAIAASDLLVLAIINYKRDPKAATPCYSE